MSSQMVCCSVAPATTIFKNHAAETSALPMKYRIASHVTCCVTVRHMCDGPYSAHPSRHMSHPLIGCDRCDGATVGWQTEASARAMSAFGGKADIAPTPLNVRL